MYDMPFLNLIQGYFVPSGVTCVNSMEVPYIPIAKARGFTTHWIKAMLVLSSDAAQGDSENRHQEAYRS